MESRFLSLPPQISSSATDLFLRTLRSCNRPGDRCLVRLPRSFWETIVRSRWTLFLILLSCAPVFAQPDSGYVTSTITQYSLSPDLLAKAHALYTVRTTLYFLETAWGILVLIGILRFRIGARLRDLAENGTQ